MSDTFYGSDFDALREFDPEIAGVLVSELESLSPLARRVAETQEVVAALPRAHHFGHR